MKWFGLLCVAVLASPSIQGADSKAPGDEQHVPAVESNASASAIVALPPVLRKCEPSDDVVFKLPGPPPPAAPATVDAPATEVRLTPPPPDPDRPAMRRPKRDYPPDFERNSAEFLSQQIGIWSQVEARILLGEALRQRPALGDDQTVNGEILAFSDPTGRYRELELDFDRDTGLFRTLFVYPFSMTWQQCRHAFGTNVRSTQANKGRTFYSYLDRRLDVLVDGTGRVISLGMY
jgi:hypothetical protein